MSQSNRVNTNTNTAPKVQIIMKILKEFITELERTHRVPILCREIRQRDDGSMFVAISSYQIPKNVFGMVVYTNCGELRFIGFQCEETIQRYLNRTHMCIYISLDSSYSSHLFASSIQGIFEKKLMPGWPLYLDLYFQCHRYRHNPFQASRDCTATPNMFSNGDWVSKISLKYCILARMQLFECIVSNSGIRCNESLYDILDIDMSNYFNVEEEKLMTRVLLAFILSISKGEEMKCILTLNRIIYLETMLMQWRFHRLKRNPSQLQMFCGMKSVSVSEDNLQHQVISRLCEDLRILAIDYNFPQQTRNDICSTLEYSCITLFPRDDDTKIQRPRYCSTEEGLVLFTGKDSRNCCFSFTDSLDPWKCFVQIVKGRDRGRGYAYLNLEELYSVYINKYEIHECITPSLLTPIRCFADIEWKGKEFEDDDKFLVALAQAVSLTDTKQNPKQSNYEFFLTSACRNNKHSYHMITNDITFACMKRQRQFWYAVTKGLSKEDQSKVDQSVYRDRSQLRMPGTAKAGESGSHLLPYAKIFISTSSSTNNVKIAVMTHVKPQMTKTFWEASLVRSRLKKPSPHTYLPSSASIRQSCEKNNSRLIVSSSPNSNSIDPSNPIANCPANYTKLCSMLGKVVITSKSIDHIPYFIKRCFESINIRLHVSVSNQTEHKKQWVCRTHTPRPCFTVPNHRHQSNGFILYVDKHNCIFYFCFSNHCKLRKLIGTFTNTVNK